MAYDKSKTRFGKLIRIDKRQLDWIKNNKITKTDAGYLDMLINYVKKYGDASLFKMPRE
jgi:hypothetical protein